MGLFDFLNTKKRNEKPNDGKFLTQLIAGASEINTSDQQDRTYIEKGYLFNPTVHAIVSTITKNAAMAKWGIYKKDRDNTLEPYNDVLLQELLYRPNGMQTFNELIQQAIGFKLLTGNSFFWGVNGSNAMTKDKITNLYVLPSQHVNIRVNDTNTAILGYQVEYYGEDNNLIPYDNVMHLKNFNPRFDGNGDFLYGVSPLRGALTSLYTNNDAIETSRSYLLNQGPRGILTMQLDDVHGEFTEEQQQALRSRFKREQTGTKRAGQLMIAPGKWSWEDIGSSSADLKLIEHYKLTQNDICNVFGFPTILISDGQSTFSNQKEAKKALWTNVIIPALMEIRDGLNHWLAPMFGDDICLDFDVKDIMELQSDIESQASAIAKLQNVITINEARAMIGKAPLEGPEGEEMYRFVQGVEKEGGKNESKSETES